MPWRSAVDGLQSMWLDSGQSPSRHGLKSRELWKIAGAEAASAQNHNVCLKKNLLQDLFPNFV
jgi:hypothetical protein